MSDYDVDYEIVCPKCGHTPTHSRECNECDEGFTLPYDEDPVNFSEDEFEVCQECKGVGWVHWCPSCGYELVDHDFDKYNFNSEAEHDSNPL